MAEIQGYLLRYRDDPEEAVAKVNSLENQVVPVCSQCETSNVFTLSSPSAYIRSLIFSR